MTFDEEMMTELAALVVEDRELLQGMEGMLLGLHAEEDKCESINAIFRAVHTIKGSASMFGLNHIVRFTHVVETILDMLRCQSLPLSSELIDILLHCQDVISSYINEVAEGNMDGSPKIHEASAAAIAKLQPFLKYNETHTPSDGDTHASIEKSDPINTKNFHISIRFGPQSLREGTDPLSFIRYLETIGEVINVTTISDAVPPISDINPELCYLTYEVTLRTHETRETIENIFHIVDDHSRIRVLPHGEEIEEYIRLVESYGNGGSRLAHTLIAYGAMPSHLLLAVNHEWKDLANKLKGIANTSIDSISTPIARKQQPAKTMSSTCRENNVETLGREQRNIRVDATRLDKLIDVIGELVVAGANAGVRAAHSGDNSVREVMSEIMRLVEEVRDSALQLRMVPIGATFSRFQRVVHDVGADLGKDVALIVTGGETELDKALVERIGDPLLHLVRNSMDHGIEPPEVRQQRGKPSRGTLKLNAYHDSGTIVIEVSDDGGGIDRDRILAKAIERGLVDSDAVLSDAEIYSFIFEPGFSTAEQISDLSGRGVGMDVVKRNIKALRGSIDIESQHGIGSTIRIRLPLTLAIIDGFLVRVGESSFVIPLDRVVECVELPPRSDKHDCMDLRGEVLPFIRLRSLFSINGSRPRRENVIVVEHEGMKTGLVVDTLLGGFQTVIKPLGRLFENVCGIGGFTILGTGEVALIIDVSMLAQHCEQQEQIRQLIGAAST